MHKFDFPEDMPFRKAFSMCKDKDELIHTYVRITDICLWNMGVDVMHNIISSVWVNKLQKLSLCVPHIEKHLGMSIEEFREMRKAG